MSYIHVIVETKASGKTKSKHYIEKDCVDENEVLEDIIIPYVSESARILIEGAFVSSKDIEKMLVFRSEENSDFLYEKARAESDRQASRMASEGVFMAGFGPTLFGAIHDGAEDITKTIIREAMKKAK